MLDRQRQVGEAHVHHRRRVALAGRQVHHAALGSRLSRRPSPRSYCSTSGSTWRTPARASSRSAVEVDLDVEVAGVGQHRAVLHALEVLAAQDARASP